MGFAQWRVGFAAIEIVSRIVPVALDVIEERSGMPADVVTALVMAKFEEGRATWTRVQPKTITLFVQAIASLLSDLET